MTPVQLRFYADRRRPLVHTLLKSSVRTTETLRVSDPKRAYGLSPAVIPFRRGRPVRCGPASGHGFGAFGTVCEGFGPGWRGYLCRVGPEGGSSAGPTATAEDLAGRAGTRPAVVRRPDPQLVDPTPRVVPIRRTPDAVRARSPWTRCRRAASDALKCKR